MKKLQSHLDENTRVDLLMKGPRKMKEVTQLSEINIKDQAKWS